MPLLVGADEVSAVVVSVTLLVVSLQKLATVVFPYRRERGGYANAIKCDSKCIQSPWISSRPSTVYTFMITVSSCGITLQ